MKKPSPKVPFSVWMIIAGFLLIILASSLRLFQGLELMTYDKRSQLRPALKVSDDIVLITIDDLTLNQLGQWPFPRDFYASLIDVLRAFGAKAVVLDILFPESSPYDELLAQSMGEAKNVYLSTAYQIEGGRGIENISAKNNPLQADITPALKAQARAIGHINPIVDSDGKIRRVPLFVRYQGDLIPQVTLKAAFDWFGVSLDDLKLENNSLYLGGKLKLPLAHNNIFLVNYPGRWATSFRQVSYFEVLKSYMDLEQGKVPTVDLNSLKGKICFVGLTATGTSDLRANPLENIYPMVGLHASLFNSILQGAFIRDAGAAVNTIINLLVFVISLWICLRFTAVRSLIANIIWVVAYVVVSVLAFNAFGLWIDVFLPIVVIVITYLGVTLFRFLNEIKKRELMEKELEIAQTIQKSFLPKEIKDLGISLSSYFEPAKFVAGDLYDVIKFDQNRSGILIADVAGKGVSASLVMAQTISLFRILARQFATTHETLSNLNKELHGRLGGRFVTALYLIAEKEQGVVSVASAGHGPVLVYRAANQSIEDIPLAGNVPLGLMKDVAYGSANFSLGPQDKAIIFSDGLPEAHNKKDEQFELPNIHKIILQNGAKSDQDMLTALKDAVKQFSFGRDLYDDLTIIVFSLNK